MGSLSVCTHCGFTHAEFRTRGLLGCPHCYASFGETLFSDLLHLHPRLHRSPARPREPLEETVAALREKFSDALRHERYEDAATLRERLRALGAAP